MLPPSKPCTSACMHLHPQHTLFPLQRSATVFSLESFTRAGARRRCLCTSRYRTQHLAKSLGAKSPREMLMIEQTSAHHCTSSSQAKSSLLKQGTKEGTRESSPRNKLKVSQEILCKHQHRFYKAFSPYRAMYRDTQAFQ